MEPPRISAPWIAGFRCAGEGKTLVRGRGDASRRHVLRRTATVGARSRAARGLAAPHARKASRTARLATAAGFLAVQRCLLGRRGDGRVLVAMGTEGLLARRGNATGPCARGQRIDGAGARYARLHARARRLTMAISARSSLKILWAIFIAGRRMCCSAASRPSPMQRRCPAIRIAQIFPQLCASTSSMTVRTTESR